MATTQETTFRVEQEAGDDDDDDDDDRYNPRTRAHTESQLRWQYGFPLDPLKYIHTYTFIFIICDVSNINYK